MTDGNRIVAEAEQGTRQSSLEGAGMIQDFYDAQAKIFSGDWTEGLVNLAGGAFTVKEFVEDPLAKLVSMGLGWVIEHVSFLRVPLDWVTGDQVYLDKMAATWKGIGDELSQAADDLAGIYRTDTDSWKGQAADTYRTFCANRVEVYRSLAVGASGTSRLFVTCKIILAVARTIIRELITDFVGRVASKLLRYPPPVTPAAIPETVSMAGDYAQKIMGWVKKVRTAFGNAAEWFKNLRKGFTRVSDYLAAADDISVQTFNSAIRQGYRAGDAAARGMAAAAKVNTRLFSEPIKAAREAAIDELPQKIVEESVKETAKPIAAGLDDSADEQGQENGVASGLRHESYLNDGSGPHRVSGEL